VKKPLSSDREEITKAIHPLEYDDSKPPCDLQDGGDGDLFNDT
jgi:hypothetical protein